MPVSPDYFVGKPNALGQVEQSASITSRVSRKKKDAESKKEKRRHRPTIDEQLEQEIAGHDPADDTNEHVDFCA
ncbi:MAG: hypothetical protein ACYTFX_03355 [Planctomycetota bacterium]|jgi:hypothetical protein